MIRFLSANILLEMSVRWHCIVDVLYPWLIGLICSGHCAATTIRNGRVRSSRKGGHTTILKLLGGTVVIGCTACQPNSNLLYFIVRRYASAVYAVVVCSGADVPYQWLSDWTHLQWALHSSTDSGRVHFVP